MLSINIDPAKDNIFPKKYIIQKIIINNPTNLTRVPETKDKIS